MWKKERLGWEELEEPECLTYELAFFDLAVVDIRVSS
jgi:hypothetical protein